MSSTIPAPILLQCSNVLDGQMLEIVIRNNPAVSWSAAPVTGGNPGFSINTASGTLPLLRLALSPSTLTLITSSSVGGRVPIGFDIQLSVVAATPVAGFELYLSADPGMQVTASFNGGVPISLGPFPSWISW